MPDPITAVVAGGTIVTGAMSSKAQSDAANKAAGAQLEAAKLSIAEQRRQFNLMQEVLAPYTRMGTKSLDRQGTLAGLNGPDAQAALIKQLENSPLFTSVAKQGENAILQNAAATGGLRGGNVQGALADFRASALNEVINAEYQRLGGLTQIGQASAAGVGAGALQTGQTISEQLTNMGQAQAGNALAQGQAQANLWGTFDKTIGLVAGKAGF